MVGAKGAEKSQGSGRRPDEGRGSAPSADKGQVSAQSTDKSWKSALHCDRNRGRTKKGSVLETSVDTV